MCTNRSFDLQYLCVESAGGPPINGDQLCLFLEAFLNLEALHHTYPLTVNYPWEQPKYQRGGGGGDNFSTSTSSSSEAKTISSSPSSSSPCPPSLSIGRCAYRTVKLGVPMIGVNESIPPRTAMNVKHDNDPEYHGPESLKIALASPRGITLTSAYTSILTGTRTPRSAPFSVFLTWLPLSPRSFLS